MGAGRDKALIADTSRLAEENDQLRKALAQLQEVAQQLQGQQAQLRQAHLVATRCLGALIRQYGQNDALLVKHRGLAEMADAGQVNIAKKDVDDTNAEFRLVSDDELRQALADRAGAGNSVAPTGDGAPVLDAPPADAADDGGMDKVNGAPGDTGESVH